LETAALPTHPDDDKIYLDRVAVSPDRSIVPGTCYRFELGGCDGIQVLEVWAVRAWENECRSPYYPKPFAFGSFGSA